MEYFSIDRISFGVRTDSKRQILVMQFTFDIYAWIALTVDWFCGVTFFESTKARINGKSSDDRKDRENTLVTVPFPKKGQ